MIEYRCPECGRDDKLHGRIKIEGWFEIDKDGVAVADHKSECDIHVPRLLQLTGESYPDSLCCQECGKSGNSDDFILDTEDAADG